MRASRSLVRGSRAVISRVRSSMVSANALEGHSPKAADRRSRSCGRASSVRNLALQAIKHSTRDNLMSSEPAVTRVEDSPPREHGAHDECPRRARDGEGAPGALDLEFLGHVRAGVVGVIRGRGGIPRRKRNDATVASAPRMPPSKAELPRPGTFTGTARAYALRISKDTPSYRVGAPKVTQTSSRFAQACATCTTLSGLLWA